MDCGDELGVECKATHDNALHGSAGIERGVLKGALMSSFRHKIVRIPNPLRFAELFGTCEKGMAAVHEPRCQAQAEYECSHITRRSHQKKPARYKQMLCAEHAKVYAERHELELPVLWIASVPPLRAATRKREAKQEEIILRPVRSLKNRDIRVTVRFSAQEIEKLTEDAARNHRKLSDYLRYLALKFSSS